ncbi:MAG: molybdenum cofactor biosynthesis protein MoaE [Proteobacteria bacterium]|nr:molybdenum cofactor biosynthesis protein MoaE [Pseudomonadota bacterium]
MEAGPLFPEVELARFLQGRDGEGAVASFTGLMRPTSKAGDPVETLELDWYPGVTEASIQAIAEDAAGRFEVGDVLVVHRCGTIRPREAIVFVAVSARHRRSAFEAADYLMDRLKTDAAFWKREDGATGSAWIEPTERDRADRARWPNDEHQE